MSIRYAPERHTLCTHSFPHLFSGSANARSSPQNAPTVLDKPPIEALTGVQVAFLRLYLFSSPFPQIPVFFDQSNWTSDRPTNQTYLNRVAAKKHICNFFRPAPPPLFLTDCTVHTYCTMHLSYNGWTTHHKKLLLCVTHLRQTVVYADVSLGREHKRSPINCEEIEGGGEVTVPLFRFRPKNISNHSSWSVRFFRECRLAPI